MTGPNSEGSTGASYADWWERPARLLRFPNDRSVGRLVIRRSERPPVEAQGDIVVPRNVRVTLIVHVEDGRIDLSPLADLGPDDLDGIVIGHREKIQHVDLAPLGQLTGLTTLSLRGPDITNGAVVHLPALTRLLHLTLRETSVDDAALETTRRFTRLERLIISGRPFSDAGIARLQNLAQLKWLDVSRPSERGERWTTREPHSGPAITGTGLAGLKSAHKLWMLDLEGTDLDDDGGDSCPACGWWTDPQALAMPNVPLGWLGVSLNQARANYQAYGTVTHGRLPLVRPPRDDEA